MRKRILQIIPTLKSAGAENVVLSLASGLDRSRFDTAVVALYDASPGDLDPLFSERGIQVWRLGKHAGPDPRMYARLSQVMHDFQPDVIHSHLYVLRYAIHLRARALVHTVHNLAASEVGPFGRLVHRCVFRRGVAAVAVGSAVADSFRRMYGFPPAATIPNGIDTDRFWRPQVRSEWRRANGFRDDDLLIVSTGRLTRQKNPVALAEAIAAIPHARLLIAGEGELRSQLEGRERVHLLGVRNDIPDMLASADMFALASDWEGLPLAVIEAMAAGLPVVATRVGGIPEAVENGRSGFLVPPGDKRALTDALQTLAENPGLRREMGAASRVRSLSFGVRAMMASYEKLFERVLGEPATTASNAGTLAVGI
jgi:glycosyltransferase involved in cell wall biosynthesis